MDVQSFKQQKPTGSHSKALFIDSCLLTQLCSRNVVSTCAFGFVYVRMLGAVCTCLGLLGLQSGRRVPDVDVVQGRKLLVIR